MADSNVASSDQPESGNARPSAGLRNQAERELLGNFLDCKFELVRLLLRSNPALRASRPPLEPWPMAQFIREFCIEDARAAHPELRDLHEKYLDQKRQLAELVAPRAYLATFVNRLIDGFDILKGNDLSTCIDSGLHEVLSKQAGSSPENSPTSEDDEPTEADLPPLGGVPPQSVPTPDNMARRPPGAAMTVRELQLELAKLNPGDEVRITINGSFARVGGVTPVPKADYVVVRGIGKLAKNDRFTVDEEGIIGHLTSLGLTNEAIGEVLGRPAESIKRKRKALGF